MKNLVVVLVLMGLSLLIACSDSPNITTPSGATTAQVLSKGGGGTPPPDQPPLQLLATGNIAAAGLNGYLGVWRFNQTSLVSAWTRAGTNYWGVGIGNVDGNSAPELVAIDRYVTNSRKVSPSLNLEIFSEGSTGSPSAFCSLLPQAYTSAQYLKIADADEDGNQEILVGGRSSLQVLEKNATGGLGWSWEYIYPDGTAEFPTSVEIGDADNDHHPEILYSSITHNDFVVFKNLGGNSWGSMLASTAFSEGMVKVTVGDIDNCHSNEIVGCGSGHSLCVYYYNGSAYVPKFSPQTFAGYPHGVAIGDFDGDGQKEIAVGTGVPGQLSIFRWSSDGTCTLLYSQAVPNVDDVAAGDCDGDGLPEIVVGTANSLMVFDYSGDAYHSYTGSIGQEIMQVCVN